MSQLLTFLQADKYKEQNKGALKIRAPYSLITIN